MKKHGEAIESFFGAVGVCAPHYYHPIAYEITELESNAPGCTASMRSKLTLVDYQPAPSVQNHGLRSHGPVCLARCTFSTPRIASNWNPGTLLPYNYDAIHLSLKAVSRHSKTTREVEDGRTALDGGLGGMLPSA